MTREQALAELKAIVVALYETIEEAGEAPLGPMYAACNAKGMSYDMFMQIIGALEHAGKIKVSNHCARIVR